MNGWKNFETWAAYSWLTNEEKTYNYWQSAAKEALEAAGGDKTGAVHELADQLREELAEMTDDMQPGLQLELLEYAIQQINCTEIAAAFLEE